MINYFLNLIKKIKINNNLQLLHNYKRIFETKRLLLIIMKKIMIKWIENYQILKKKSKLNKISNELTF